MPINIIIENVGASPRQVQEVFETVYGKLMRPDPTRAVKHVAEVWAVSYRAQGSLVGGWWRLADRTVEERVRQGFGSGPILRRSGSLYDSSIEFFLAGRPGSRSTSSHYGGRSITTTGTLNISDGTAVLGVSGPKTVHQVGSRIKGIPVRQYWFNNRASQLGARLGVLEWINKEVLEEWNK